MPFSWTLLVACSPSLELGEVQVAPDGADVRTTVAVTNVGTAPAWIWSEPVRLRPPGPDEAAALMYDVEPLDEDLIVEFFVPPPSEALLPGERAELSFAWPGTVSIRDPDLPCAALHGLACAERLEVRVAWSERPLDRPTDPALDPWTAADRLEDGVVTAAWLRLAP